jgi:hypothetical protein
VLLGKKGPVSRRSGYSKNALPPGDVKLPISLVISVFGLGLYVSLMLGISGPNGLTPFGNVFHVLYFRNEAVIFVTLLLAAAWGLRKARRSLVCCTAIAVLVQFPIRCLRAETFVRDFARAARDVQSTPESFVLLDHSKAWYSQDLMRNDPF